MSVPVRISELTRAGDPNPDSPKRGAPCLASETWVGFGMQLCHSLRRFALFQREGMFRFDSAERANREPAAGVSLQVFDVGPGSEARFFECLHRAMAIFAAHELRWATRGLVGWGKLWVMWLKGAI
jgi:hypothetical protein